MKIIILELGFVNFIKMNLTWD